MTIPSTGMSGLPFADLESTAAHAMDLDGVAPGEDDAEAGDAQVYLDGDSVAAAVLRMKGSAG